MNDDKIKKEMENIKNITTSMQIAIESLRAITAEHSKQIEKLGMAVNENSKNISKLDSAVSAIVAQIKELTAHVRTTNDMLMSVLNNQNMTINKMVNGMQKNTNNIADMIERIIDKLAKIALIAMAGFFGLKFFGL